MKKIGAKREIPNDIAFPARTGHDACEPFGSRAAIGSEPFGSRANFVCDEAFRRFIVGEFILFL